MLQKEDRIAFSRAIVDAEVQIASFDLSQQQLAKSKQNVYELDQANKRLFDSTNDLINSYHVEYGNITGVFRTSIVEQDLVDSANSVLDNYFFPNNPSAPAPSLAPGVWTKIVPYSRNKAVGKLFSEAYPAVTVGEQPAITAILALIASITTNYLVIERVTGQTCATGTCSLPQYYTQVTCEANSGVWTPGADTIVTYTQLATDLNNLITRVNELKTALLNEQANIINDPDPVKQAQNTAHLATIPAVLTSLNTWLAYSNFNNAHGQTTCAGFFGYDPSLLAPTKLYTTQLSALQSAVTSRQSYLPTRVSELDTNFGSITQSLVDGSFTGSGLYLQRFAYINLRIALVGGSLTTYLAYERRTTSQNQLKAGFQNQKDTYLTLLACSLLSAPSNNTKIIHTKDTLALSVGDNVYLVSETQEEILRTVEAVDGKRVTLGQEIPAKFRPNEKARLYKDLT